MSLLTIALFIATICLFLVVFSLMGQAMEQKRTEKRLLIAGLQRRIAQFNDLLGNFPQGYLSRDIEIFLHNSVIDACERLYQLDSSSRCHNMLQKHREAQKNLMQSPDKSSNKIQLTTAQQIKEVKSLLKELSLIIVSAVENNSLPRAQANAFKQQLNKTLLAINLESYQLAAQQAENADKLQVAIHYHEQAKKLLQSGHSPDNKLQIEQRDQIIKKLTDRLAQQASALIVKNLTNTEKLEGTSSHHPIINDDSDPTKKKQVYD